MPAPNPPTMRAVVRPRGIIGRLLLASVMAASTASGFGQSETDLDRYGGWMGRQVAPTGWFHAAEVDGRWRLIDPEGHQFLSIGVNTVSFRQDTVRATNQSPYGQAVSEKYGRPRDWAGAVVERLRGWGFNTLGAWSDRLTWRERMPYTVILRLGGSVSLREGQTFPDVFDPAFRQTIRTAVRRICRPLARDRYLLGYFTDNELRWGADWRSEDTLFVEFLQLPDDAPGRQVLVAFLRERYDTIEGLNEAWRTEYESFDQVGRTPQVGSHIPTRDQDDFLRIVAARYFRLTSEAIRSVDGNHLILGCRFAGSAPDPVLEAMVGNVDVVSLNHYGEHAPTDLIQRIHRITGSPVLITEFGFRARDSGLPNSKGAGAIVDTQEERAEAFERYVSELMEVPAVVGYHWFQHADQPAAGRFDGEDSNCGLVDIQDEPYEALVETMSRVNGRLYERPLARAPQPGD